MYSNIFYALYYMVTCDLSGSKIIFNIISYKARFSGENFIEHKTWHFDFLYNFCLKYFSSLE